MSRFKRLIENSKIILKKFFPNWKHIVIKVPLILIALYYMLVGVLYITSVPSFCLLCHEMKPYGNQWKNSNHANVPCIKCHVEPSIVKQALHKVVALKELYAHLTNSYEFPIIPKELIPVDKACMSCHPLTREFSLSGDLKMPHEKHYNVLADEPLKIKVSGWEEAEVHFEKNRCVYCHFNVVHADKEEDRRPQMEFCMDNCHNGKKAPENCDLCHTKKNVPKSHLAENWFKVHGAKQTEEDCKSCHGWRPDFCADCHKKKPESHTARWRTFHGDKARGDTKGCFACHSDKFCMKCHGILPE
jgi:hypothetical protein